MLFRGPELTAVFFLGIFKAPIQNFSRIFKACKNQFEAELTGKMSENENRWFFASQICIFTEHRCFGLASRVGVCTVCVCTVCVYVRFLSLNSTVKGQSFMLRIRGSRILTS